jgi:SAM-dependent methyltransferase
VITEANYDPAALDGFAFASRKFPEHMHFRLMRCRDCDVVFANPAPLAEDVVAQYEGAAYDSSVEADLAAATYAKYLRRHLPLFAQRSGALEIGSGNGAFLEQLVSLGFTEVVGVEPSLAPIQAAKPAVRALLRHAPFRASDFAPGSLGFVACFQTLEHVLHPGEMTREIYDRLRPGGGIFFVAHNYRSLVNRAMGMRSPIYDVEHAQLFCPRSLARLVGRVGFTSVRTFGIVNSYPLRYWLRLAPLGRALKTRFIDALDRVQLGRVPIALPVGNMGVVAIKPP